MSKELEALKFIKNVEIEIGNDLTTATKVFEINHEYDEAFEIIEKELKAFEIIKEKKVDVYRLMQCHFVAEYNMTYVRKRKYELRKYEYDLLNEVLLWKEFY